MVSGVKAKAIEKCRVCGKGGLVPILSLGEQYISDFIENESQQGQKIPLELVLCEVKNGGCGLLQLRHTTPPELMYTHYWYLSGLNESMKAALADISASVESIVRPSKGDIVLDIGCNDGTLLRSYRAEGILRVGIDPAKNLPQYSSVGTTKIINDYFSARAFHAHYPGRKAKAITAIAMFYDLDDPNSFVADIVGVLDPKGVFIIQMSYLPLMLQTNAFDNICHEHLEYYSLLSLRNLLSRHNLEIIDATLNDVNGGSFRVYCRFRGSKLQPNPGAAQRLAALEAEEAALQLDSRKPYEEFSARVDGIRKQVVDFVSREASAGRKIYVYGASTKGNTLLQTFGLS